MADAKCLRLKMLADGVDEIEMQDGNEQMRWSPQVR